MKILLNLRFIILISQFYLVYTENGVIGRTCVVTATRKAGTCQIVTKCPSALAALKNRQRLTLCGHVGPIQVVCCESSLTKPPNQPKPTIPGHLLNSKRNLKCNEYAKAVYEVSERIRLQNGTIHEVKIDRCANTVVTHIVGGLPALPKEFPHSALLGYKNTMDGGIAWGCGGSLVSRKYVITAGHCLKSRDHGDVTYVRLGDLNIASDNDDASPETFLIEKIIPYPDYTTSTQYNDIALIKLEKTVELNPYIRPICLPLIKTTINKRAIAIGWGNIEWASKRSDSLLKVTLDLYSASECADTYKYDINSRLEFGIVDETQLCAGSKTKLKDSCEGDSGGSLQMYHSNIYCMYELYGITSFGKACGISHSPSVYTRVSSYVDWIESVIWPV